MGTPTPARSAVLPTARVKAAPIQPTRRASVLPTIPRQMASRVLQGQQQAWYQLPLFPVIASTMRPARAAAGLPIPSVLTGGHPLGDSPLVMALAANAAD